MNKHYLYHTTAHTRRLDFKVITWLTLLPYLLLLPIILPFALVETLMDKVILPAIEWIGDCRWALRRHVWAHYRLARRIGDDGKVGGPIPQPCSREKGHDGPCNGWSCEEVER